ncbi:phosphomethylpyrimidine synthase ThiC, partial [Xanthomonas sp. Kuri4-1]
MNAMPRSLLQQTQTLSEAVTRPIPGSRRIYVEGSRADLRVPMREIVLTPTPTLFGGEDNPPVTVYDTSGPYTDPAAAIDLAAGLAPLRAGWIAERGDSVALDGLSSALRDEGLRIPAQVDIDVAALGALDRTGTSSP